MRIEIRVKDEHMDIRKEFHVFNKDKAIGKSLINRDKAISETTRFLEAAWRVLDIGVVDTKESSPTTKKESVTGADIPWRELEELRLKGTHDSNHTQNWWD
jgi:hypothetical protein